MDGIIIKGIGGFYYVKTEDGEIFSCRARGKFRKDGIVPMVGDFATIDVTDNEKKEGYVVKIKERKNQFVRPPVANIDTLLVTLAVKSPEPNLELIDRLTVTAEAQGVKCAICINKADLDKEEARKLAKEYILAGYKTIIASAETGEGTDELKELLKGRITALAGSSGVGKSSLINAIGESFSLKTGEVSEKILRGKHTTRHTELFPLSFGGFVFDTPGFGSFELSKMMASKLSGLFPEIKKHEGGCRFLGCSHISEPDCSVKDAVENGEIGKKRYESYTKMWEELKDVKDWEL